MSDPFGGGRMPPPDPQDLRRLERRVLGWAIGGLAGIVLVGVAATTAAVLLSRSGDGDDRDAPAYAVAGATPGDCVDLSSSDKYDATRTLVRAGCDARHDAEVVAAGALSRHDIAVYVADGVLFCEVEAKRAGYQPVVSSGRHSLNPIVDSSDAAQPRVGDRFLCVAEARGTAVLTEALPRGEPTEVADAVVGPAQLHTNQLDTGDCFNVLEAEGGLIEGASRRPCDQAHRFQVVGSIDIADPTYPDESRIERLASGCIRLFEDFLGITHDDSQYDFGYFWPSRSSWQEDDRTITCVAEHPRGKDLTRDLEGIAR